MILNVTKPDVSDLDFVARVKAAFPHCEVIMLTGVQVAQTAIEALSVGTSAFLIRPVGSQELLSHIERAAPRRNLQMDRDLYLQELEDRVRQQTCEVQDAHEETINRLMAAAKYRDEETGAHVRRVGLLSEALAAALGWPVNQTDLLRMAAPMHDIGKIGIPDAILQKSGKLSAQEFEIMKTHSLIGAGMLSGSKSPVMQMAEKVARAHHERWDGGGYPHGLRGEEIPECARIVAVVDVFDALTHDRVYRPAVCEQETLAMLERGRQTHFDSRCVSAFIEILPLVRRISLKTFDDLDGGPGVAKRGSRLKYRERFRSSLQRQFTGYRIAELSTEQDLHNTLSPSFPRALLRRGTAGIAAIGASEESLNPADALSFGLIWLDHLRRREPKLTIHALAIFLPVGFEGSTCHRIRHLNPAAAHYLVFVHQAQHEAQVDPRDYQNFDTRLPIAMQPLSGASRRTLEWVRRLTSILALNGATGRMAP